MNHTMEAPAAPFSAVPAVEAAGGADGAALAAALRQLMQAAAEPAGDRADAAPDSPVLLLASGGPDPIDPGRKAALTLLLQRGVARALAETGTAAGGPAGPAGASDGSGVVGKAGGAVLALASASGDSLAALFGQATLDARPRPTLIGVAAAGSVALMSPTEAAKAAPVVDGVGPFADAATLTPGSDALLVLPRPTTSGLDADLALAEDARLLVDTADDLAHLKPKVLLLIGGDRRALLQVREAVRRQWPVVVVRGSGGSADWLLRHIEGKKPQPTTDAVITEIRSDGDLTVVDLAGSAAADTLHRTLAGLLGGQSVVRNAWLRFAALDAAAKRQQAQFFKAQWWILAIGLIAVALAVLQTQFKAMSAEHLAELKAAATAANSRAATATAVTAVAAAAASGAQALPLTTAQVDDLSAEAAEAELRHQGRKRLLDRIEQLLGYVLILVPIGLSVLIAANNRFNPGKRWVLLRSGAEDIKREIYRYRMRVGEYARGQAGHRLALVNALTDVTRRLARTEVNTTALPAYRGHLPPEYAAHKADGGMADLSTAEYVRWRLEDQIAFFKGKTEDLERQLRRLQYGVLGSGAVGTLCAALQGGWVIWITFTTALTSALMTYLNYRQVESTLTSYNQTATDLDNIRAWWGALSDDERLEDSNVDLLVSHTEKSLAANVSGWTQRMADALEKLKKDQQGKEGKEEEGAGQGGGGQGGGGQGDGAGRRAEARDDAGARGRDGGGDGGRRERTVAGMMPTGQSLAQGAGTDSGTTDADDANTTVTPSTDAADASQGEQPAREGVDPSGGAQPADGNTMTGSDAVTAAAGEGGTTSPGETGAGDAATPGTETAVPRG